MSYIISIITVLSSFAVVYIFRQMDKNNRNFEKIAKLSKTIQNDLASFSGERFQELKDLDNCIEVSFQKGRGILDEMNKSFNAVEQRFELLEREKEKISTFYKKIDMVDKELSDVHSQINEINENREFLEKLSGRIDSYKKQLAVVERDIGRVQDNIKKENETSLKAASSMIIKEASEEIHGLKKEVEIVKKDLFTKKDELIENIKNSGFELRNDLVKTQEELIHFTKNQHGMFKENADIFRKEINEIEANIQDLKGNFFKEVEDEFYSLNSVYDKKIDEKANEIKNIENDFRIKLEDKINDYSNYISRIEEHSDKLSGRIKIELDESKNSIIHELKSVSGTLLEEIGNHNEKLKINAVTAVNKTVSDIEVKQRALFGEFKKVEKEVAVKVADFENFYNSITDQIDKVKHGTYREINDKINEFDLHIKNASELGKALELEIFETIKGDLSKFKDSIETDISAVKTNALNIVSSFQSELSGKYEDAIEEIAVTEHKINELKSGLNDVSGNINGEISRISEKQKNIGAEFDGKIADIRSQYDIDIEKYKKLLSTNLIKIKDYFDKEKDKVYADIDRSLSSLTKDADNRNSEISVKFERTYKDVEKKMIAVQVELEKKAGKLEKYIYDSNKGIEDNLIHNFENIKSGLLQKQSVFENEIESLEESFNLKIDNYIDKFDKILLENINVNENKISELNGKIVTFEENFSKSNDKLAKNEQELNAFKEEIFSEIKNYSDEIRIIKESSKEKLNGAIEELENRLFMDFKDRYNNYEIELNNLLATLKDNVEKSVQECDHNLENSQAALTGSITDIKEYFNKEKDKISLSIDKSIELLSKETAGKTVTLSGKFEKALKSIEQKLMAAHSELSNKTGRIENMVESGRNRMEAEFDQSISVIKKEIFNRQNNFEKELLKIEEDFKVRIVIFKDNFEKSFLENNKQLDSKIGLMNDKLENFESSVNSIIDENQEKFVKNQKQVEDFKNELQGTIRGYNSEFENLKLSAKNSIESAAKEIEQALFEDAKGRYSDQKEKINELLHELKGMVDNGIEKSDVFLLEAKEQSMNSIQNMKNDLKKKIEDWQEYILEAIKSKTHDVNEYKNEIFKSVEEINGQYKAKFDENKKEIDHYMNSVYTRMETAESDFSSKIRGIEDNYHKVGEELINNNSVKLDEFVSKFSVLSEEIRSLKSKLDGEINEKLEKGKIEIAEVFASGDSRLKESLNKLDQESTEKMNEYRREMIKINQNMKQIDDRFTAKFLDHANMLDKKIFGIEEEVKKFEKSTKLFEKVEELKVRLSEDIKILKEDISNVKVERNEILKIEKKMVSIENIISASNDKYKVIMDEKKNIENIEAILTELKQISENVDSRVSSIKAGKVMIENIDTKLDSINEKFTRLDKYYDEIKVKEGQMKYSVDLIETVKKQTGDMTGKINEMHKSLNDLEFKRSTYEKSFKNFEKEANLITKSEQKVAEVIDKFKQMDSLIEDLELRTNVINKYREWLVKAETQIVNLNQDTDKKIKLLESLLEESSESALVKNKVNDDSSKRETVLKLKKQGWTIDEISKSLNLSIGEVEFILDLEHSRKNK